MASGTKGKRNIGISLVRIIAMCFIVLCHLGSYCSNAAVAQFFNIGVPIFFALSGYLYGSKDISGWGKWYGLRWARLMLPCYVFFALLASANALWLDKAPNMRQIIAMLFNLQGLSFVVREIGDYAAYPGLGHLWFMTVLMLCYLLLPALQKLRPWVSGLGPRRKQLFLFLAIAVSVALACETSICIGNFVVFAFGYYYRGCCAPATAKAFSAWSAGAAIAVAARLLGRHYWDATPAYDIGIVYVTHFYLAIFICKAIVTLWKRAESCPGASRLVSLAKKRLPFWDEMTFYIYIAHYAFMTGPLSAALLFCDGKLSGIIAILLLSVASAYALMAISRPLVRGASRLFS